jgi:hypothetical protein
MILLFFISVYLNIKKYRFDFFKDKYIFKKYLKIEAIAFSNPFLNLIVSQVKV